MTLMPAHLVEKDATVSMGIELIKQVHQSLVGDLTVNLSQKELVRLYRAIETALPDEPNRMVQFISAYKGEGASTIAFETAVVASQVMGKRVLFIDTGASHFEIINEAITPLDVTLLSGRSPYDAIAHFSGTGLYITRLRQSMDDSSPTASLNAVEKALDNLRTVFDLIIIDSPAILKDALAISFAKLAHGSILVVEAERTRAPVAVEAKRIVESGGGRVIGAVMSKRRFYIPPFLYRILYKNIH